MELKSALAVGRKDAQADEVAGEKPSLLEPVKMTSSDTLGSINTFDQWTLPRTSALLEPKKSFSSSA
jgi:hypothetical protein